MQILERLDMVNSQEQILDIFSKFVNEYKGLDLLSNKQKSKLFEFIINIIICKIPNDTKVNALLMSVPRNSPLMNVRQFYGSSNIIWHHPFYKSAKHKRECRASTS